MSQYVQVEAFHVCKTCDRGVDVLDVPQESCGHNRDTHVEVRYLEMVPKRDYDRVAELLKGFVEVEKEPCSFDHHGNCQEHGWFGDKPGECGTREARELLGLDD